MTTPTNTKYSKSDEWVKVDGKIATIGVTDFAQNQLSDVVFVEITVSVGELVGPGAACATIESVKAAADVTSPVSGIVVEINEKISEKPEKVNSDPYGEAWMVKVELSTWAELELMMDAANYDTYCQERNH